MSHTKASFSHLPLPLFEGTLTRKLRFHIFHFHFLKEISHESFVFTSPLSLFEGTLARKLRFHIFHFHFLKELSHESFVFTSPLSLFEGTLARKLRFHIFHFHILRELSQESFVFTSSTFTCSGNSRTKAFVFTSPLSLFEGTLARKLRFHIFQFHFSREVSHEMRF